MLCFHELAGEDANGGLRAITRNGVVSAFGLGGGYGHGGVHRKRYMPPSGCGGWRYLEGEGGAYFGVGRLISPHQQMLLSIWKRSIVSTALMESEGCRGLPEVEYD